MANMHQIPKLLIVGAFPRKQLDVHGGVLTACSVLAESSLPKKIKICLVDSTSYFVPPKGIVYRTFKAIVKLTVYFYRLITFRPNVVLLFASPGASYLEKTLMGLIAQILGGKSIMFLQGLRIIDQASGKDFYSRFLRASFNFPNIMLCQGGAYQKYFVDEIGLAIDECPIIKNWTATKELLDIGLRRDYISNDISINILFLGWVSIDKGIFEFLESIKQLKDICLINNCRVLIAGNGGAMDQAKEFVRVNKLDSLIEFLGWINGGEKAVVLSKSQILVLPSYSEGMPNAVIEAMSAGLAVVATDVGCMRDLVEDGVNGLLVPSKDINYLRKSIEKLLYNRSLCSNMGHIGYKKAKDEFYIEPAVNKLVELTRILMLK